MITAPNIARAAQSLQLNGGAARRINSGRYYIAHMQRSRPQPRQVRARAMPTSGARVSQSVSQYTQITARRIRPERTCNYTVIVTLLH